MSQPPDGAGVGWMGSAVGFVVRVELLLTARRVHELAEVSLLVEQPDRHHRNAEVAGSLQVVTREHAEPARVERDRVAETIFHAEVRGRPPQPRAVESRRQVALPGFEQPAQFGGERGIGRERGQAGRGASCRISQGLRVISQVSGSMRRHR